ncbi:hypothetical protein D3C87_1889850 [compost metagenome]
MDLHHRRHLFAAAGFGVCFASPDLAADLDFVASAFAAAVDVVGSVDHHRL